MDSHCPLCDRIESGDYLAENALAVAVLDSFPLNPGHTLIIPRRHIADLFELSNEGLAALWALLPVAKQVIDAQHAPPAYNVGVNVGSAAGQTVAHVHVHLIPRFPGDVPDPRGGVRWVVPSRAAYWNRQP
jgi:diadenosine tetraphosphate (Ap4A) HIT family hydrolase